MVNGFLGVGGAVGVQGLVMEGTGVLMEGAGTGDLSFGALGFGWGAAHCWGEFVVRLAWEMMTVVC